MCCTSLQVIRMCFSVLVFLLAQCAIRVPRAPFWVIRPCWVISSRGVTQSFLPPAHDLQVDGSRGLSTAVSKKILMCIARPSALVALCCAFGVVVGNTRVGWCTCSNFPPLFSTKLEAAAQRPPDCVSGSKRNSRTARATTQRISITAQQHVSTTNNQQQENNNNNQPQQPQQPQHTHNNNNTTTPHHTTTPHNTHTTPTQHPHNTHTTPTQHPHNTHTTPTQHPHNTHTTPTQHPHNTHTTPTQHPHNTHTTPTQPTHNTHTTNTQPTHKRHTNDTQTTHKQHPHNTHTTPTQPTHNQHTTNTQTTHKQHTNNSNSHSSSHSHSNSHSHKCTVTRRATTPATAATRNTKQATTATTVPSSCVPEHTHSPASMPALQKTAETTNNVTWHHTAWKLHRSVRVRNPRLLVPNSKTLARRAKTSVVHQ